MQKIRLRVAAIWLVLFSAVTVPMILAGLSPLLAWRQPVYILAGFAGVAGMTLLFVQPLLAAGYLPGLTMPAARKLHRWLGGCLVVAVLLHVAGLYLTSPPDVVDALLFRSPTAFSVWGVVAMWAAVAAAILAPLRWRLPLNPKAWRRVHTSLAQIVVVGSVVHALLVEGTMETVSKVALCSLVVLASIKAVLDLKIWTKSRKRHS